MQVRTIQIRNLRKVQNLILAKRRVEKIPCFLEIPLSHRSNIKFYFDEEAHYTYRQFVLIPKTFVWILCVAGKPRRRNPVIQEKVAEFLTSKRFYFGCVRLFVKEITSEPARSINTSSYIGDETSTQQRICRRIFRGDLPKSSSILAQDYKRSSSANSCFDLESGQISSREFICISRSYFYRRHESSNFFCSRWFIFVVTL